MSGPPLDPHPAFVAWLEREGRLLPPNALVEQVLTRTRTVERRPGWLTRERWLPHDRTAHPGARRLVALAVLVGLVIVAVAIIPAANRRGSEPGRGSFEPSASLISARASHTATLLPDGRVLVIGGDIDAVDTAEMRDAVTGVFHSAGTMGDPRVGHTATLLLDERILVIGGPNLGSLEVWDLEVGSVAHVPLARDRSDHTATLLPDGRVLVIGGDDSQVGADLWDPETRRFIAAGALGQARSHHEAVRLPDGRVLVVGGGPAEAELWDPASRTFSPAGRLVQPRWGARATLVGDGRVLVTGGFVPPVSDRDAAAIASAELWDPVSMTFADAGTMADGRGRHTATLLDDGRVLVVGGRSRPLEPLSTAELWDPVTRTFQATAPLGEARVDHTADLLRDGRVLVIGGSGVGGEPLRTTELWDPLGSVVASPDPAAVVWGPRSLDHDWPGPLRPEPVGQPTVVPPERIVRKVGKEKRASTGYEDAAGDVPYRWLDVTTFRAGRKGASFDVAGRAVAPIPDPSERWIAYGVVLDREGDGVPDVRLGMDNAPGGEHRAWLTDLVTGETVARVGGPYGMGAIRVDTWFPGAQIDDGGWFQGPLPGARLYIWASLIEGGRVVATDYAPDSGWVDATLDLDE